MPELTYDGRKIAVAAGTNLVDAGLAAGVPVPIFCYHQALGAVGACRVCAVTVTMKERSRMVMACMTAAEDGMQVTTLDPQSVAFRKWVLEWLMENHPLDCPICDEGGECQLQDLTIAAGHGIRRFREPKRTFQNQFLGEFIVHEMNRCITCYRCSRFYQEVAGGRDFGVTGSRDRVYFGRFEDGPLESPFSGNLVELCPTGVFTDKLFRYRSRVWDLEIAPSICPHCSVGCNVLPAARHRELQRVRVRANPAVNGVFLCDRGQFGHGYVEDPKRPREPMVAGARAEWDDALTLAAAELLAIARAHGPAAIALLGSSRASLESLMSLLSLAEGPLAGARVSCFDDPARELRALAALGALAAAGVAPLDQGDIAGCDALLIAGASLVDEAPVAALAARQAARNGSRLFVLGPGERYLGDVAELVAPLHPADLGAALEQIAGGLKASNGDLPLAPVAAALAAARRPAVLLGSDLLDGAAFEAGAALARALASDGRVARLGCVFPGPNGFGAAALSSAPALAGILAAIESREVRAAVLVESDLADLRPWVLAALARLQLLVVLDYVDHPALAAARVVLPTTATYECEGLYVNRAGRAQAFRAARAPGLAVPALIRGESFPREPARTPPQGAARPAWWALERLRELAVGQPPARELRAIRLDLARRDPAWAGLAELEPGSEGLVLPVAAPAAAPRLPAFEPPRERLALFRLDRTLGSEPLSRRSPAMQRMAGPPVARLSVGDAERLKLDGRVAIELAGERIELAARADRWVADGVVLVPRDLVLPQPVGQGAPVSVTAPGAGPEPPGGAVGLGEATRSAGSEGGRR
jgi:NADH-quinone oxidoreductase subunit G